MMERTYLFYDIESSGLSKPFDQVMQFAAIRTDMDLNEIERHEVFVRVNPDLTPSPYACITHRIWPDQCQQGLPEDQALCQIHQWMNAPGTISVGYNTLSFDDEFLRFSFFRNLLTPYTHQYANQCGRMDIYPMLIMYYLYQRDVLQWPILEGRPSMKLEHIAVLNGLMQGAAHNALIDVEATIALARHLKHANPAQWNWLVSSFHKTDDLQRMTTQLPKIDIAGRSFLQGLYILPKLGNRVHFQAPVIKLGSPDVDAGNRFQKGFASTHTRNIPQNSRSHTDRQTTKSSNHSNDFYHRHYKNQTLWLRLDLPELRNTDPLDPKGTSWVLNKKLGEPGLLLPYQDRFIKHLTPERLEEVQQNLAYLNAHPEVLSAIEEYHLEAKYPVDPQTDVEASLYQARFLSDAEIRLCEQFHQASPVRKHRMMSTMPEPLATLALRLLGRHYPEVLNAEETAQFDAFRHSTHITDFKGELKRSQEMAYTELGELRANQSLDDEQRRLLAAWEPFWRASR